MSDIYDGAFRTIINDCKQFLLPYINEVFGEHYTGEETIEFCPNEHFIDQQDHPDIKRITDTNFFVKGKTIKKYHLECESSRYSSKILIRLFEYDAQIALDDASFGEDKITVTFPNTSVLYLRSTSKTPDTMEIEINVPGGQARYSVPILKINNYSIDEIFEKRLYLLIPFYIFTYESEFAVYNNNRQRLQELKHEFEKIVGKLDSLVEQEILTSFDRRLIMEISEDVLKELARKHDILKQEVGDVMCGALIETEARRIHNEGIEIGIEQGIEQGIDIGSLYTLISQIKKKLSVGKDMERIADEVEETVEKIQPIVDILMEHPEYDVDEVYERLTELKNC